MMLPGWCEKCHRYRPRVRVTRLRPGNLQTGVCVQCQAAEDERQQKVWQERRNR